MLIRIFNLISILILGSCISTNKHPIQGYYVNEKPTWVEMCLHPFDHYALARQLDVYRDSTFRLQSCGSIAKGVWWVKQDSLILIFQSNKSTKDSSVTYNNIRYSYAVRSDGKLFHLIDSKLNDHKIRDLLVKVK